MTETTSRLGLPLLYAAQAQKEMTHNEALTRIDMLLHAAVEAAGATVPPPDPQPGQCWIVGADALEAWVGKADHLAAWTPGGWRFAAPQHGMRVWCRQDAADATFDGAVWQTGIVSGQAFSTGGEQVVGPRLPPVASPSGGTMIDAEARVALAAILDRLRHHGLIANG